MLDKNFDYSKDYFKWFKEEQLLPQSEKLLKYYNSAWYKNEERKAFDSHSFTIDWDKFESVKRKKDLYSLA